MTLEVHRRAARILAPGIRASEVTRFLEEAHRAIGAPGGNSFCIVQFGRATAFPHGLPGDAQLQEGDVVLIDVGCLVEGYNSDITRTYVYGEADADQRRIWALERKRRRPRSTPRCPARRARQSTPRRAPSSKRRGWVPTIACPGYRTAPGMASACRSTSPPIWCAATRRRSPSACVFRTSR